MPVYDDLFAKRDQPLPDVFQRHELPEGFRNQVLWIWRDVFLERHRDCLNELWAIVCRENGVDRLYPNSRDSVDDLVSTLKFGKNITLVLQIIELSFKIMFGMEKRLGTSFAKHYTDELNRRFREHGIGYQFDAHTYRLIPINAPVVHEQAVRPALLLLSHPDFATAEKEMGEAWDEFKLSKFGDCLTKCCSCFESVMKIICDKNRWTPAGKTAQPLINCIVDNCGLPTFFKQQLIIIAEMRNALSSSHGAGTAPRNPPEQIARYALNATASAILLLVEVTGV